MASGLPVFATDPWRNSGSDRGWNQWRPGDGTRSRGAGGSAARLDESSGALSRLAQDGAAAVAAKFEQRAQARALEDFYFEAIGGALSARDAFAVTMLKNGVGERWLSNAPKKSASCSATAVKLSVRLRLLLRLRRRSRVDRNPASRSNCRPSSVSSPNERPKPQVSGKPSPIDRAVAADARHAAEQRIARDLAGDRALVGLQNNFVPRHFAPGNRDRAGVVSMTRSGLTEGRAPRATLRQRRGFPSKTVTGSPQPECAAASAAR